MSAIAEDAVVVVRLQWGSASQIDTDLQAVVVHRDGKIIDAAYYNNMKACGGKALVHSGDEGGAAGGHGREEVRLTLPLVPKDVHMILILVCCYSGGTLDLVPGASVTVEQAKPTKQLLHDAPVGVEASGLLVSGFVRQASGGWQLRPIGEALLNTRHFMDCLAEINRHIVAEIPTANRKQKVAFAMEKGGNFDFAGSLTKVVLGLGWDVEKGQVDLDASAVLLDKDAQVLESIFFGNLRCSGSHSTPGAVEHSGDNLTGEGDGDDEQLTVCLDQLGATVRDIFFCIHIYSKARNGQPKTFRHVANPYCRVVEGGLDGEELCRYTLVDAGDRSGLIIARIRRGVDGRFSFNALGVPSRGTMYKDSIPEMQRIASLDPRQLQSLPTKVLRSPTLLFAEASPDSATSSLPGTQMGGTDPQLGGVKAMPPIPEGHGQKCCVLQ